MFHRIFLRDEYRLDPLLGNGLDCVVDLGGNVGLFSARVVPHAKRVITCEPVPENFARLEKNLSEYANVIRLNIAVSDSIKELQIFMPQRDASSGSFSAHREGHEGRLSEDCITVPALSLAELMKNHDVEEIDLLKIDVEGAEYEILHAAVDLIPRVKRIHGEYHNVNAQDPRTRIENFEAFLRQAGFTVDILPHAKKDNHGLFFATRNG